MADDEKDMCVFEIQCPTEILPALLILKRSSFNTAYFGAVPFCIKKSTGFGNEKTCFYYLATEETLFRTASRVDFIRDHATLTNLKRRKYSGVRRKWISPEINRKKI
eukprot:3937735-Rhodomonas_salina.1